MMNELKDANENLMEFDLHTDDIQYLEIGLIYYGVREDSVMPEKDRKRICEMLTKLNNLCTAKNNYTLKIAVK